MHRLIASVTLALALSGCGAGNDSSAETGSSSSKEPHNARSSSTPTAKRLTDAELEKTLPVLSDLSAGFTASKDDDADESDKDFLCGADLKTKKGRTAEASADFSMQEGLSFQQFTFGVSQYSSVDQARSLVDEFADIVEKCPKFTSDGDSYAVTPMSAGRLGDQTSAYRLTTSTQGIDVVVNILIARRGPGIVSSLSASAGLTGSTITELSSLTGATVTKYAEAAALD